MEYKGKEVPLRVLDIIRKHNKKEDGELSSLECCNMELCDEFKDCYSCIFWPYKKTIADEFIETNVGKDLPKSDEPEVDGVDPKKVCGDKKDPMHLLPTEPMRSTAKVIALGASKYGEYNWRLSEGVQAMTYVAAIYRHIMQFVDGEDKDEESGESHLAHIMATCSILLDAKRVGKLIDNRPKIETREANDGM